VHHHVQDVLNPLIVWLLFFGTSVGGLWLSYTVGFLGWGAAVWLVGVLYSIEPVRFKRRFGLDILGQLFAWWILPFLAPVWGVVPQEIVLSIVIIMSFINWSVFYPYQIADYEADKKANLQNTHVMLGVRRSTQFGLALGIVGLVLFFLFGFGRFVLPLLPLFVVQFIVLGIYIHWLSSKKDAYILAGMQKYSQIVKAIGLVVPLYFFLWWRLM
jgi:4-hydroxybenzoate polyprenyltransferase